MSNVFDQFHACKYLLPLEYTRISIMFIQTYFRLESSIGAFFPCIAIVFFFSVFLLVNASLCARILCRLIFQRHFRFFIELAKMRSYTHLWCCSIRCAADVIRCNSIPRWGINYLKKQNQLSFARPPTAAKWTVAHMIGMLTDIQTSHTLEFVLHYPKISIQSIGSWK